MKEGKTLTALAAEIQRQTVQKADYVADTRKLEMTHVTRNTETGTHRSLMLNMQNGDNTMMPVLDNAHRQIAERLGIPIKYYNKMVAEAPDLLATNVNRWFTQTPEKRMVRTLDGNVRAFLSDRYQRIDNFDVANVVLPVLSSIDGIQAVSTEITDNRMYIKAVTKQMSGRVMSKRGGKVGELVSGGVMITNSEVGLGAVQVKPFAFFLVCTNGMVVDKGMRAAHVGRRNTVDGEIGELLTDETKKAEDRAVLLKVRDVVAAAFDQARFSQWIERLNATTADRIEGNPAETIELLANEMNWAEAEKGLVLQHFVEGGDLSRFGLMNAITRTAEDVDSYDRATEFETMGGQLLELSRTEWTRISTVQ